MKNPLSKPQLSKKQFLVCCFIEPNNSSSYVQKIFENFEDALSFFNALVSADCYSPELRVIRWDGYFENGRFISLDV